jgi:hypothetical protein
MSKSIPSCSEKDRKITIICDHISCTWKVNVQDILTYVEQNMLKHIYQAVTHTKGQNTYVLAEEDDAYIGHRVCV